MIALDPVLFRELPAIHQIILNETSRESERRGYLVFPDDQVVRENVCRVVLLIGEQLRRTTEWQLAHTLMLSPSPDYPEAA